MKKDYCLNNTDGLSTIKPTNKVLEVIGICLTIAIVSFSFAVMFVSQI